MLLCLTTHTHANIRTNTYAYAYKHTCLENADYFLLTTIQYSTTILASVCVCLCLCRREPTPLLHSFSTVFCAITARFAVLQRTMNELQSRSFDCRIAAAASADGGVIVVVFVAVVAWLWRLCSVGVVVVGSPPPPYRLCRQNGKWKCVRPCTDAIHRNFQRMLPLTMVRCDIFFVAFAYIQFSTHKYFNQTTLRVFGIFRK